MYKDSIFTLEQLFQIKFKLVMNKLINILLILFLSISCLFSQENMLPKGFDSLEENMMDIYLANLPSSQDIITEPPLFSVRTMAEWEEVQALTIAWEGFEPILTEIVRNSVNQCKVIIACDNPNQVDNYLQNNNVETSNVEYLDISTNSIWMRDYGQNTIYKNDVDSIMLVDWIYNRPRPDDDSFPESLAEYLDFDLYQTSDNPYCNFQLGKQPLYRNSYMRLPFDHCQSFLEPL